MVFLKFVLDFQRSSGGQAIACAARLQVVARRCDRGVAEQTRGVAFGGEEGYAWCFAATGGGNWQGGVLRWQRGGRTHEAFHELDFEVLVHFLGIYTSCLYNKWNCRLGSCQWAGAVGVEPPAQSDDLQNLDKTTLGATQEQPLRSLGISIATRV